MDDRYPRTPASVRVYIYLYPILMAVLSTWLPNRGWVWIASILTGLAWFGAICIFIANALRREGYQAAFEDQSDPTSPLTD